MWGWQEREMIVPVKLYRFKEPDKDPGTDHATQDSKPQKRPEVQIIVLWIDESELGERPLLATHRILNKLFATVDPEHQSKLTVSMVGPMSSDSLETMLDKAKKLSENGSESGPSIEKQDFQHWFLSSYSKNKANGSEDRQHCVQPMTGFMPLLRSYPVGEAEGLGTPKIFSPRATKAGLGDFQAKHFLQLHRCIGTDKDLAESVYRELESRGVFPGRVVLITEHDTGYGRAIPETYESTFNQLWADRNKSDTDKISFQTFAILRGIDGELPGEDDGNGNGPSRSIDKSDNTLPEIIERRPEGRSQYDYMRRLARRIEAQPGVRAIGILGSDVYDKLLVLRALKPQFPGCLFFTTDLDAIYSHSSERKHTRNLLIASHYSLFLPKELQTQTAPFRDSYQTATFLATKLAVKNAHVLHKIRDDMGEQWDELYDQNRNNTMLATSIHPLMMVVGRDQIHPLPRSETSPSNSDAAVALNPTLVERNPASHYLFVITVVILLATMCWIFLNRDWLIGSPLRQELGNSTVLYSLLILLSSGLLLACVFYLRGKFSVERAPFLAGYSTWPTKFVYSLTGIASVGTCGYLVHHWCRKLDRISEFNNLIGKRSSRCFQSVHTVKIGLLALVMTYIAGVFTYPLESYRFWVPGSLAVLPLLVIWLYWTKQVVKKGPVIGGSDDDAPPAKDVILGTDLRRSIGLALLCMIGVTLLALIPWLERAMRGASTADGRWFPTHFSRGFFSREGDYLANLFAFGTVGLLLSSLLFFHLWCREFARYVLKKPADELQPPAQEKRKEWGGGGAGEDLIAESKNERDRLWTIGQLSAITGRFGPALLGLLFLLVIGFHPNFSPVAMPTSLLVVATLFVILYVASTLTLRWHFLWERQRVLARLERNLLKYHEDQQAEPAPVDSVASLPAKRIAADLPFEYRVDTLMEIVPPNDAGATAAATLTTAVMQQKEPASGVDVDHEVQVRRDQLAALSDGVFRSWNQSPMGWILGGGATIALVDLWIRAWTIGI
jgi:hypothetical protein